MTSDHPISETSCEMLTFKLLAKSESVAPRLGQFALQGRHTILTPTYVATTSRGIIPHVTHDVVQKHTSIPAVYMGLEDFTERSSPVFKAPLQELNESPLRGFTALPDSCISILGPRRVPSVPSAQQNTSSSIGISTSVGFASLTVDEYNASTEHLFPDVSVAIADLVTTEQISKKRVEKSADRTHAWLRDTLTTQKSDSRPRPLFASIPPLEAERQSFYLSDMANEYQDDISGICTYSPDTTSAIPEALSTLPRLCLSEPQTPHEALRAIALGVDLITLPFVNFASEAGIAFAFEFGNSAPTASVSEKMQKPLGIDMWSNEHATDIGPLTRDCGCYACTRHHRAYIHHLLQAKEMLAWTLIQIHNFHNIHQLFAKVRETIANNTFDDCHNAFSSCYESEMPKQTGEGPRVRGYQVKSVGGGESKKNTKAYGRLEEQARKIEEAESGVGAPTITEDAQTLVDHGFARKVE